MGHKEFRYAVVPEQEGELLLPELAVHWWDTANDRPQTAVLPAQTLTVLPSALVPAAPEPLLPGAPGATSTAVSGAQQAPAGAGWWRLLTMLFAVLWLSTLALYWRSRDRGKMLAEAGRRDPGPGAGEHDLLDGLRRACESGEPAAVRQRLYAWLRDYGPADAAGSLLDFAAGEADPDLRASIHALDSEGFRSRGRQDPATGDWPSWSGRDFWERFEHWRRAWRAGERERRADLTDLYAPANRQR